MELVTKNITKSDLKPLRLSELLDNVSKVIQTTFSKKRYWVLGEVSNFKINSLKGYVYFNLVEKKASSNEILAKVQVNSWSTEKIREFEKATGQLFKNEIQVLLQCEVAFHSQYGISLNLIEIDPTFTLGALALARQSTINKLVSDVDGIVMSDGELITPNKKLPLPRVINRVALITANNSDGYRDFLKELTYNRFGYRIQLTPHFVPVQGAGAEDHIMKQLLLIRFNRSKFDVVAIVRGGGSDTDLLTFDSYKISKELATFPIPVFTGIGHDRNETICDMVARVHTKVPTKAAESIIHNNRIYEQQMLQLFSTGVIAIESILKDTKSSVKNVFEKGFNEILKLIQSEKESRKLMAVRFTSAVSSVMERFKDQLNSNIQSVIRSITEIVQSSKNDLKVFDLTIQVHDPERILNEGYALVEKGGLVVDSVGGVNEGDELVLSLKDGKLNVKVTS